LSLPGRYLVKTSGKEPIAVQERRWGVGQELNILALVKGAEHYVYIYDDDSRLSLLEAFQTQAANTELSLNWFDAAVLTQKAHEQAEIVEQQERCLEGRY
jgi:hypothetical protein